MGCRFVQLSLLFLGMLSILIVPVSSYANSKYASLVIDAETGVVLSQENAGQYRYPASLTKMMTLYLAFRALEQRKISMHQKIKVSSRAAAQQPSKLHLNRGERISVRDLILSIIVKSANDSAVVLAEHIGGSEWEFALEMNRMAKRLGMNHTHFRNASGLHDRRQKTTAYDMARLAVALKRDFPKYYHLFNRTKFFYKGRTYTSHNYVTKKYRGADGLKTGYTRASGYNLATSAKRNGRSVVAVVLGGRSSKRRDRHMIKLLDSAFYKMAKGYSTRNRMVTAKAPVPELKPGTVHAARQKLNKAFQMASLEHKEAEPSPVIHSSSKNKLDDFFIRRGVSMNLRPRSKDVPMPALKPGI